MIGFFFRLYVVERMPRRSLTILSVSGRKNMTVAFSTLAESCSWWGVIACQAKLRSKYSRLADSVKWILVLQRLRFISIRKLYIYFF